MQLDPMQSIVDTKKKMIQKKEEADKKMKQQLHRLEMKRKYPKETYHMAAQFEKNKEILKKLQEKVKQSRLRQIPTEVCDLETMLKTDKKVSIKSVAKVKIKRDHILERMRKDKIVQKRLAMMKT